MADSNSKRGDMPLSAFPGPVATGGRDASQASRSDLFDAQAVREVLAGKIERFADLVEKYKGLVYAVAFGYLKDAHSAEDAAQEIFLRAYGALSRLRSPESFAAWILQIARNYSSREALRSSRRQRAEAVSPEELRDAVSEARVEDMRAACILELVERLPEPARHTVLLKYQQGLSCREIAEMEGVPVGTITSRLSRALVQLREAAGRIGIS